MRIFSFHSQPHVSPYTHAARSLGFARTTRAETRASSAHTWGAATDAKDGSNGAKGTRHTKTQKILGEFYNLSHFYHKKTVNKKKGGNKGGHTKKNSGHSKKNIQTSSRQNKKRATRSLCRRPTTRRIRREHVNARERYRTHALRCGQTACNPVGNTQRFALVGLCAPRIGFEQNFHQMWSMKNKH